MNLQAGSSDAHASDFEQFTRIANGFAQAILSNDAARIATFLSPDWVLVTPEVGPVARQQFLQNIERGLLQHHTMEIDIARVKVYDDIALVTGRGRNTGAYAGQPIKADEWTTDVFRRIDGRWYCALTQLTPVADG
jgi:ketosteroid isomerase-like protein